MARGLLGMLAGAALRGGMRGGRNSMGYGNYGMNGMGGGFGMRPRRRRSSLLGIIMILIAGYFGSHQLRQNTSGPIPTTQIIGRAQQVVDGDTFHLQGYSIRLWGIDAPERDTPAGPGATQTLQALLKGRDIICQPIDRSYQRIVASCTMNGRDISQAMVRLGWAKDLPNKSGRRYASDEASAKSEHRGMWKI